MEVRWSEPNDTVGVAEVSFACSRLVEYAAAYFTGEICDGFSIIVLPHVIPFSIVTPFLQSTRSTCSAQLRLLACLMHVFEFTTILSNELNLPLNRKKFLRRRNETLDTLIRSKHRGRGHAFDSRPLSTLGLLELILAQQRVALFKTDLNVHKSAT